MAEGSDTAAPRLVVTWQETGGASVAPPPRHGFGPSVIERMLAHELGGHGALAFEPEGLRWLVRITLTEAYRASDRRQTVQIIASGRRCPGDATNCGSSDRRYGPASA